MPEKIPPERNKLAMKQPPPDHQQELFLSDLSALNRLYRAVKVFLARPSPTTEMALKLTLEEAEKTFFSQEDHLTKAAGKRHRCALSERTGSSRY